MASLKLFCALLIALYIVEIQGHGMMLDPPGRSSRWRTDSTAPSNYNDNSLYCGGFWNQWGVHNGKCGLCGDDFSITPPRPNEIGGYYGANGGVIVKNYNALTANIGVSITANHLGYLYWNLCNLDEFGKESEECFQKYRLKLADGSDRNNIGSKTGYIETTVVFPPGLSCRHCVLRWTYNAGNNWGTCEDGTGAMGCGAQENFVNCADISINASLSRLIVSEPEIPPEVAQT